MISLASPRAQYEAHKSQIDAALTRVLQSGTYILGDEVDGFEREFAAFCGVSHAVGVGSGTDALILAMRALGIAVGDEVITVSHTALATVAAVLATGATPVLVDIDPDSYTINAALVEQAITPRTKAVIAVHLYGCPADLDALEKIAKRRGLALIEDCAQAAGARYGPTRVGSIGNVGCFSFYPTKNLGAIGDGGMVVASDPQLAERIRCLRQYGWNSDRRTEEPGLNSRLDPLQAAILRAKLPHLDADNVRRAAIAERYRRGFSGCPLSLPIQPPYATHVYHLFVISCDDRDQLALHLRRRGIGSAVHYPTPAHRHGGYGERVRMPSLGLPCTDRAAPRILSLPIYPELTDGEVNHVIEAVRIHYNVVN